MTLVLGGPLIWGIAADAQIANGKGIGMRGRMWYRLLTSDFLLDF